MNFNFNFAPLPDSGLSGRADGPVTRPNVICNIPGEDDFACNTGFGISADRTTPFLQETVTIDGQQYLHLVVGQPADGFAQEVLIRSTTRIMFGNRLSDSGGHTAANGADPLRPDAEFTGNGTGNPNSVIMKQVMSDPAGGFTQEFLKGALDRKAIISQDVENELMASNFVMDMSNSDFNTDDTAGIMTNTLSFTDPNIPGTSANFDFAQDAGASANVDSGRYTFTPVDGIQPGGTYTYWDGTIDPVLDVNWEGFKDPSQNP